MYVPAQFKEEDLPTLHQFMRDNAFATIITTHDGSLVASHVPFILDAERGPLGTLVGHLALGNPQWRSFDGVQEALIIFQGPHSYISPSWYEQPVGSVPTWNYAIVHAYGIPQRIEDESDVLRLLSTQVSTYDAAVEGTTYIFDPQQEGERKRARGVVGFTIAIQRLQGKYKLSQNRSQNDQQRVIAALQETGHPSNSEVAELMHKRLSQRE